MGKAQDVVVWNFGGSKRKYEFKKYPIIVIIQHNIQIIIKKINTLLATFVFSLTYIAFE